MSAAGKVGIMKLFQKLLLGLFWATGPHVWAATHYVNLVSTNPTPPYTNWATAATTIQDAVDAAGAADFVMVMDGVYRSGGRVAYGSMTNRVVVTNAITVRSLHGPAHTRIDG